MIAAGLQGPFRHEYEVLFRDDEVMVVVEESFPGAAYGLVEVWEKGRDVYGYLGTTDEDFLIEQCERQREHNEANPDFDEERDDE